MARLSAMMFLPAAALGIWAVTVGSYLAANTGTAGNGLYSAGFAGYSAAASAVGGLIAPVVIGWLSDRYFSAERLMAWLHLGCAISAVGFYRSQSEIGFLISLLAYFHCFTPAVALANKVAFRHLLDADAEYPTIRTFSAIGWILVGLLIGLAWPYATGSSIEATRVPFLLGAIVSFITAIYSLTLPPTRPTPKNTGNDHQAIVTNWSSLRSRDTILFLLVSIIASMPIVIYHNFANPFLNQQNYQNAAALLTIGQGTELLLLIVLPWLLLRIDMRSLTLWGIIAWAVRFALLSMVTSVSEVSGFGLVLIAILLHGPGIVFLFVVGQMYINRLVDEAHQGAAQGWYSAATFGIGPLFGSLIAGLCQQNFLTPKDISPPPYNWSFFWSVSLVISVVAAIALVFAIPRKVGSPERRSC